MDAAASIKDQYQGLEVARILANLAAGTPPKFKEVTALVRAAHGFVEETDRQVLAALDLRSYLEEALEVYVAQDAIRRIANIWGKDPDRKLSSIRQLALEAGIGEVERATRPILRDEELTELARLTPKEARQRLLAKSL
jgi:ribonuclease D